VAFLVFILLIAVLVYLIIPFVLLVRTRTLHDQLNGLERALYALDNRLARLTSLPAVLMAVLARVIRNTRPQPVYIIAAVTAIVLALAYLTLEVRTLFHGSVLNDPFMSDAEDYTYSAVWLAFGVALLLVGIALKSQPARLASAAVVILDIVKVFLHDLAGVQGIYRALSFIGLGLVLIGIGWLYQRLSFPRPTSPDAANPPVL
jgi:uncharacterized membrane protein